MFEFGNEPRRNPLDYYGEGFFDSYHIYIKKIIFQMLFKDLSDRFAEGTYGGLHTGILTIYKRYAFLDVSFLEDKARFHIYELQIDDYDWTICPDNLDMARWEVEHKQIQGTDKERAYHNAKFLLNYVREELLKINIEIMKNLL